MRDISTAVGLIDQGVLRCAIHVDDEWVANLWVKKALDLYYRLGVPAVETRMGTMTFRDRFPLKGDLEKYHVRFAPPGTARFGAYFGPDSVLAGGYAHLGVWVGSGTLIDTWVTLGTCAQIGNRVKVLPNSSIVGSLYPLDAAPTVIEDDCYLGSGCVIGSGVRVAQGAILAPGVVVSEVSPVVDAGSGAILESIPPGAVVLPGMIARPSLGPGVLGTVAALVVGYRDEGLTPKQNLRRFALFSG